MYSGFMTTGIFYCRISCLVRMRLQYIQLQCYFVLTSLKSTIGLALLGCRSQNLRLIECMQNYPCPLICLFSHALHSSH
uniref:Uncharacterized protein n=1 Tax=Manihot esculenta TaxID=3983 RepID=A0A2C9UC69_MANES